MERGIMVLMRRRKRSGITPASYKGTADAATSNRRYHASCASDSFQPLPINPSVIASVACHTHTIQHTTKMSMMRERVVNEVHERE